jgi:hypothetical protein
MVSRLARRATTLSTACLLELLLIVVLVRSLHSVPPAPGTVMVFISRGQRLQSARPASAPRPRPDAELGRTLLQPLAAPDWRSLPQPSANYPSGNFPPASPHARAPPDWTAAAREAAVDAADQVLLTRQRLQAMDELPDERQQSHHASFPWSHQRRTPWLDFDVRTLTASLHLGRRCVLVLAVILPGFGCVLGHLDDDSRGDLFDPALLPPPLQLPQPPPTARQPSSPTGDPAAAMP